MDREGRSGDGIVVSKSGKHLVDQGNDSLVDFIFGSGLDDVLDSGCDESCEEVEYLGSYVSSDADVDVASVDTDLGCLELQLTLVELWFEGDGSTDALDFDTHLALGVYDPYSYDVAIPDDVYLYILDGQDE